MLIQDILGNTLRIRKMFTDTDTGELTDVDNLLVSVIKSSTTVVTYTEADTDVISKEATGVYAIKLATIATAIFATSGYYTIYTDCEYVGDVYRSKDTLQLRT